VLEEVILAQFAIQYCVDTCCLRAPWIVEKDDFRCSVSFGDDVFGGPVWNTFVTPEVAKRCQAAGTEPLLRDALGRPLKRNIVHVEDLVSAILAALDNPAARNKLYNVCMRARRIRGGCGLSEGDSRSGFPGHFQQLPFDLDGQQPGKIRAGMAAPL
jgi:nucleoside-diphosphate-sugar epimerase